MPKSLYDNEENPTPVPAESAAQASGEVVHEEFDISSFDFTIADPGEIAEFSDSVSSDSGDGAEFSPTEEQEAPKKEKFSLKKFSRTVSEKAEKLMEDSPRKEKVRVKKEKTPKPPKASAENLPEEPRQKPEFRFRGGTFRQVSRRWMRYALRPSTLFENLPEFWWPLFLGGVMVFFGAFYLLIGLDWYFADLISMGRLWAIVFVGLLVGGTVALLFAAGTQGLSMLCRKERIRPFRVLSAVAGACVYPSALLILGLLIRLIFRASVSMSFGITAVLWVMYVLLDVLRDLFGEKNLFKSVILIVLWGFALFALMSLTFTLK